MKFYHFIKTTAMNKEQLEAKARRVYEKCTLENLSNPNGTRMDIAYAAMCEMYHEGERSSNPLLLLEKEYDRVKNISATIQTKQYRYKVTRLTELQRAINLIKELSGYTAALSGIDLDQVVYVPGDPEGDIYVDDLAADGQEGYYLRKTTIRQLTFK